jgi:transmembrane sensor
MPPDSSELHGADAPLWEAIARFHAGESSPAEAARVKAHLAEHDVDAALLERLDEHYRSEPTGDAAPVDVEAALVSVRRRLIGVDAPAPPTLRVVHGEAGHSRSSWRTIAAGVAATLVIALGVAQWNSRRVPAGEFTAGSQAFVTDAGRQDSLQLVDGTRVVLGPDSRLSIDSGYNRVHRTLRLAGVAHFTVAHDGARPFIVRTGAAEVLDIGTAFVVKTEGSQGVIVSVTDGRVRLTPTGGTRSFDLAAGDRAVVAPAAPVSVARGVSTADDVAWTAGRLVYRDATVAEVAADLRRWYGVDLQVDDALRARTLRAEFRTDSLSQALRIIALVLGAEVEERGSTLWLRPQERSGSR